MQKMKTIKKILTILLTLTLSTLFAQKGYNKCDIEKVKTVHENIDNLTYEMVENFLLTFDSSCETNIEFSQWSNEMLYKLFEKDPDLTLKVLEQSNLNNIETLLDEIKNPIKETDYQKIYDKILRTEKRSQLQEKILKSIEVAADKQGLKIKN